MYVSISYKSTREMKHTEAEMSCEVIMGDVIIILEGEVAWCIQCEPEGCISNITLVGAVLQSRDSVTKLCSEFCFFHLIKLLSLSCSREN